MKINKMKLRWKSKSFSHELKYELNYCNLLIRNTERSFLQCNQKKRKEKKYLTGYLFNKINNAHLR